MKIYSLQEENDKLNASRGIVHPGINHDMFDVKKTAPAPRQTRKAASPSPQQGGWVSPPARQRQMTSSSQQRNMHSPSPQQKPPQSQKRRLGLLVGWLILMLFLFLVSYISDMF